MARRLLRGSLVSSLVLAVLLPAAPAYAFTDVPSSHWAYTAITYVAQTNKWMNDFGSNVFKPEDSELRKYLAKALVKAYAPNEPIDPKIHFPDLPDSDPFYPFANIATKLGWIPKYESGKWAPNDPIQVSGFDKAIVLAMKLNAAVLGLQRIHETDGEPYVVSERFPYLQIARTLQLHLNHADETQDIQSTTFIKRDEAAYSLWKAKTLLEWQLDKLERFEDIALAYLKPSMTAKRNITQYALDQIGLRPYIWGGEWNAASPPGYCCGTQPQAGMDCSGFVWWVMKKNENNYNSAQFRVYGGWSLLERSSSEMARYAPTEISFGSLQVGDLMFFASNGGSNYTDVDHMGIYVGKSWMIHTASGNNGAALEWVGDGYYFDIFVYGRRLIGVAPQIHPILEDYTTAGDRGAI
ncbi:hypothetical protein BH20ACT24_BH20ACT24_04650 [soil metagenome]